MGHGPQQEREKKSHLIAGMKSYSSSPLLMYIDVLDHSVRTNIWACSSGNEKKERKKKRRACILPELLVFQIY